MHTIYADKLFKNKDILSSINLDTERPLTIDFKNVSEFNVSYLYTMLDLQKIAIFNGIKLNIKNTSPIIKKILSDTGIYKTLTGLSTNPILINKRLNFS